MLTLKDSNPSLPAAGPEVKFTEIWPATEWPKLRDAWLDLFTSSPKSSFCTNPSWVETWLDTFGRRLDVKAMLFEGPDGPVGACLLVGSKRSVLRPRRISLNTAGEHADDTTFVEFNHLLCRPGWEDVVAGALVELLRPQDWDEFALDGFTPGCDYEALKKAFAAFDLRETWHPSYWVDLSRLRQSGTTYQAALTGHCRKLLRQNLRSYSALGPIRLEPATDTAMALSMFDQLSDLNCRRCAATRRRSVFRSTHFTAFHRRLIGKCFTEGWIQFLRLSAGDRTIGILYSFVHERKVAFYQCGFDYAQGNRLSPGVVTLAHAIQYCLDLGMDDWDFLSGDAEYKRMLSTGTRQLVWAVFQSGGVRLRIVDAARAVKRSWSAPWRLNSGMLPCSKR